MDHIEDDIERRAEAEMRITRFLTRQIRNATSYFGYPEVPENNDLSILGISGIAKLHLNNAGDPWVQGNARMHTKDFEIEVLRKIAELYGIEDRFWGYVTSGGTEGNLYGAYMAREFFAQRKQTCVYIYSSASHYSVPKNARLLNLPVLEIKAQASGEMDYHKLKEHLHVIAREKPETGILLNLNIGTTMHGAIDQISEIQHLLSACDIPSEHVLIHADAALLGLIYPFTEQYVDLFGHGVTSIAISGHKFLGAIHPCGIFLTRKDLHAHSFGEQWVSYVGTQDTTISGSRNGFLALNLWYLLYKKGIRGYREEALRCINNAIYLYDQLKAINYPETGLFPGQNIVTFRKPPEEIISRYQLATQENLAHIVVMQHVTQSRIRGFIRDLKKSLQPTDQ